VPRRADKAFPPGQVAAFASSSPYARCVNTGGPVTFGEPDGPTLERLRPDGREVLCGFNSFLAVPLTARDTIVGMLAVARTRARPRSAAATSRPPSGWRTRPERRSPTR
jgi:GAF domain-containing protein